MRSWSLPFAIEAALCAGLHTLVAPFALFAVLAPMEWWGALLVVGFLLAATVALAAYWQLALATIERRLLRFGALYWAGIVATVIVVAMLTRAEVWWPWAVAMVPPVASGLHFSFLQLGRGRQLECGE